MPISKKLVQARAFVCVCVLGYWVQSHSVQAANPETSPNVMPTKSLAVVMDPNQDPKQRLGGVHALSNSLNKNELDLIFDFLSAKPNGNERNLPAIEAIKNELMNKLLEQEPACPGFCKLLVTIYRDEGQDVAMRNYSLQHLVTWYEATPQNPPWEKRQIKAELWKAAKRADSLSGTAILGLHRLAASECSVGVEQIGAAAFDLVKSKEVSVASRITALQVCSEENNFQAVEVIREIVASGEPMALRGSAIAALGSLGNERDMVLLTALKRTSEFELYPAINHAVSTLRHKLRLQKQSEN